MATQLRNGGITATEDYLRTRANYARRLVRLSSDDAAYDRLLEIAVDHCARLHSLAEANAKVVEFGIGRSGHCEI